MAPLQLHRTFGGCTDSISAIDWSADAQWIAVGSKDLTCRCFARSALTVPRDQHGTDVPQFIETLIIQHTDACP